MFDHFAPGSDIVVREVWGGHPWLHHPVRVVSDETLIAGGVLAVLLEDGMPLTFPRHPRQRHPWAPRRAWSGPTVLQLRRPGDWYSVWKFFDGQTFRHWYVNLERPFVRRAGVEKLAAGIDIDDLELDLVISPDGSRIWKDVERLHARLEDQRMSDADLRHVLAAAAEVSGLLDRDDRWWAPWDDWVPPRR